MIKIIRYSDDPNVDDISIFIYFHPDNPTEAKINVIDVTSEEQLLNYILHNNIDFIVTQSIEKNKEDYELLNNLPLYIQNKWMHFNDYENHGYEIILEYNKITLDDNSPYFSIFTPLYNSNIEYLQEAYDHFNESNFKEWEWILLDDSPEQLDYVINWLNTLNDIRVRYHRIDDVTKGNIGLAKWRACSFCSGKYLIEMDHDDYMETWALNVLYDAIQEYPNNKFIYSDCSEINDEHNVICQYGKDYEFNLKYGHYAKSYSPDNMYWKMSVIVPPLNSCTIRHIGGVGNHLRCWERNFYYSIGGHNKNLIIADDYELIVRSFLHTKFTYINSALYIQRYDTNTQSSNVPLIQTLTNHVGTYYNKQLHNYFIDHNIDDPGYVEDSAWNTIQNNLGNFDLEELMDTYMPEYEIV